MQRVVSCYKETKQLVPMEVVAEAENANVFCFDFLRMADVGAFFDSDVPFGKPLKKIAKKGVKI